MWRDRFVGESVFGIQIQNDQKSNKTKTFFKSVVVTVLGVFMA